jgi:hypothetical protein
MKLISVQSRGNRLVRVIDRGGFSGYRYKVEPKVMGKARFRIRDCYCYQTEEAALQAAEEWLEGATV